MENNITEFANGDQKTSKYDIMHLWAKIIGFALIIIISACESQKTHLLSGVWDARNFLKYPSDTISMEDDFDDQVERITVKTDSGIMVISHFWDSVTTILPSTRADVVRFHFDDQSHGIMSIYEVDLEGPSSNEEPGFTARNYNFWVSESSGRNYLIIDYKFSQYGRELDTMEYHLSANILTIAGDKLTRIEKQK